MAELDNAKREAFCRHYVAMPKPNGSEAARLAGYAVKSAHVQASQLLKDPKVAARIAELTTNALSEPGTPQAERAEVMDALKEKAERIVKHLEYMASSDMGKLGDFLSIPGLSELPEDVRLAIHSIDITETVRRDPSGDGTYTERQYKLRLHDKLGSIKLWLQKHALIAPAQQAPSDKLAKGEVPEGEYEITFEIPRASG